MTEPEVPDTASRQAIPGFPGYFATIDGHIETANGLRMATVIQYPRVRVRVDGRRVAVPVHTLVALAFHGLRHNGAQIDHLDDEPANSRPENLAYKAPEENAARRRHAPHNAMKTHYKRGHAFDTANTYWESPTKRHCRVCRRTNMARARLK